VHRGLFHIFCRLCYKSVRVLYIDQYSLAVVCCTGKVTNNFLCCQRRSNEVNAGCGELETGIPFRVPSSLWCRPPLTHGRVLVYTTEQHFLDCFFPVSWRQQLADWVGWWILMRWDGQPRIACGLQSGVEILNSLGRSNRARPACLATLAGSAPIRW